MGAMLIRADAGVRIGSGHVLRCLALAQAWKQEGGDAVLLTSPDLGALSRRLTDEGIRIETLAEAPGSQEDALRTAALARQESASWIVVDGYALGPGYRSILRASGARVLAFDDDGRESPDTADLLLQPAAADPGYGGDARRLAGNRYLLLRREFLPWRSWKRPPAGLPLKILVTMGGSDPDNVAGRVLEALRIAGLPAWEAVLVAGPANPHADGLEAFLRERRLPIRLERSVQDMAPLMSWADLAVSAAGSTGWELAFMGLPSLLMVLAENQRPVADALRRAGAAESLGDAGSIGPSAIALPLARLAKDPAALEAMSVRGRRLVDGAGAKRIVARMRCELLTLRPAGPEDSRMVWEWANDPDVRAVSFTTAPIPWEGHERWYREKLQDPDCRLILATDESGAGVAQIRYDVAGREAVVSYSLARPFRGRGWGGPLLARACRRVGAEVGLDRLHASIKEGNAASERAFAEAGFVRQGDEVVRDQKASHWIMPKGLLR